MDNKEVVQERMTPEHLQLDFGSPEEAERFNQKFCAKFEGKGFDLAQVTTVDGNVVSINLSNFSEGREALLDLI